MDRRSVRFRQVERRVEEMTIRARIADAADGSPPIVLVHGLSMSGRYMMPTARALAPDFPVYVPDLPGFGRSARPDRVLSIAELADALASWMKAMGIEKAALLGNSFGCQVIASFALRHPQQISHAILVGPTVDPKGRTAWQQATRLLLIGLLDEPVSLIPIALHDYARTGLRRTLQTLDFLLRDPIEEKLAQIHVSTLIVRGDRDKIVPQRWAQKAEGLLPRGKLVVIPNAAHAVNYEAPQALADVVRLFLSRSL